MKTSNILFLLAFFLSSISFAQKKTVVKGKIINNKGLTELYFEKLFPETILDTVKIDKSGRFVIKFKIKISDFYKIRFTEKDYIFYIPEPGEKAFVELDYNNLRKALIKGSKHTELVYSLIENNEKLDAKLQAQKRAYEKAKKDLLREMIKKNSNSLACLIFIEGLDISKDFDYYKILNDSLEEFPGNPIVDQFRHDYNTNIKFAIGSKALDIVLNNQDGEEVKLSSLRGKYVLIDFWASWCRPCRTESPDLIRLYKKYKPEGFEIYSVSFDNNKENWLKAIKDDQLGEWIHVSDLQGLNSPESNLYNVVSVPYTILLDKEGTIMAKELRGIELEKKLKEIFKK